MQQMSPQFTSPNSDKAFMDKIGWPLIIVLATFVATFIGAIILGTTHIIGFSWIVAILVGIMFAIMAFCVWYTFRTRKKLQGQYNQDIATIKKDVSTFKDDMRSMREDETRHWNEWAVSFTAQVDKEHRERAEELKRQCLEAIHDAELRLDVSVKNAQTLFSGAFDSNKIAVDLYREQLIQAQKQMKALEERLSNAPAPGDEKESPENS